MRRDPSKIVDLEEANAELTQSLERCRELLTECRSKLAANSNEAADDDDAEETRLA